MIYSGTVFRPPSEADSLLLQITIGCSHNRCDFCAMYRDKRFCVRGLDDIFDDIEAALGQSPFSCALPDRKMVTVPSPVRRIFLRDGDAMVLGTGELAQILERLTAAFPDLQRVSSYANARNILNKSDAELALLRQNRLELIYLGLESGSDRILAANHKGSNAREMIDAVKKARHAGIKSSVIYLLGLGGRELWEENARASARAVSEMNPAYLSALTVMVVPGTPLHDRVLSGEFVRPEPHELLRELRLLLQEVNVSACVFRSNHASNYLALAGRLPRDKERLIAEVDEALDSGQTRPEFLRGL